MAKGGDGVLKSSGGAPGFAKAKPAPTGPMFQSSAGRAPNSGQTKMPANQGGRGGSPKD